MSCVGCRDSTTRSLREVGEGATFNNVPGRRLAWENPARLAWFRDSAGLREGQNPTGHVNASPASLPGWLARPFPYDSFIRDSSPVCPDAHTSRLTRRGVSAVTRHFHSPHWRAWFNKARLGVTI